MKRNNLFRWIIALLLVCFLGACKNDELAEPTYTIDLNGTPDVYETLNQNGLLEVPIKITCEKGLKSAHYKLVTKPGDKLIIDPVAVNIPVSGNTLDTIIKIVVPNYLYSVVFAVYDMDDKINVRTVYVESVKEIALHSFKGGVDFRKTVCVGIPFSISGNLESKYDLASLSLIPVVNGTAATPVAVAISNKTEMDYTQLVPVVAGLQYVLVKAENMYGGITLDTFKVQNVVNSDFMELVLEGGVKELSRIVKKSSNILTGVLTSGSDIASLKYATKVDGVFGAAKEIDLGGEGNEFQFELDLPGQQGLEALRLMAVNKNGIEVTTDYKVWDIIFFKDVEMSTDPNDKKSFMAVYDKVAIFGDATAKSKQGRIDFYLANKGTSGVQPLSPHAYGAGTAYYDACKSSFSGFTELTYLFLSARRGKLVWDEFNRIGTEKELNDLINYRIMGPNPDGENYKITTASRRVGETFNLSDKKDGGIVIGWGSHTHPTVTPAVVNNVAFGIVWVKSVTKKENGHYVVVFDMKCPSEDQRAANNTSSIAPYSPYPL